MTNLFTHGEQPMSRHACRECERLRRFIADQDQRRIQDLQKLAAVQEQLATERQQRATEREVLQRQLDLWTDRQADLIAGRP